MRLSYSGLVCLPSKEDIVSSNLISRSTVNAFTKSFLLQLILDTRIGYLGSFLLYWKISPDTYYVSGAWSVMSVGILDNDGGVYYNSYGRRSPDSFMYYNYTSFYVIEDGSMFYICSLMFLQVLSFVMEIPI